MLFWIFVGIVGVVTIGTWLYYGSEWGEWLEGVLFAILASIISTIVLGIVFVIIGANTKLEEISSETNSYDLKSLGNSKDVEGSFSGTVFVSRGYIGEKQVFNYIRSEGEGVVLRQQDATSSVIYEGDYTPRVEITAYEMGSPWLSPWTSKTYTAAFYVPEGTVATTYEVTPNGG